jgi:hypothetical protein
MGTEVLDSFLRELTRRRRVVLLGGLAVIAHGFSRTTKDADVWLEPLESPEAWATALGEVVSAFPGTMLARLPHWMPIRTTAEIAETAEDIGMVRVLGLECPLDVFRRPNEIEENAFDEVWGRATLKDDGVFLPDAIDLLVSKQETQRDRDSEDIHFLEAKIRRELGERLVAATPEEAAAIFARYVDHVVCERALANPHPAVQAQARALLAELAESGDWFARDVLARGQA